MSGPPDLRATREELLGQRSALLRQQDTLRLQHEDILRQEEDTRRQQKAVRQQQDATQAKIMDVDEHLNALLPVNRLPVEILVEIFYLSLNIPSDFFERRHTTIAPQLKSISGVCRHWRKVACSTPRLWRFVGVCSSPAWLALCLERCAGLLVDISLGERKNRSDMRYILSSSISQIRSLSFLACAYTDMSLAASILSKPCTALEDLSICAQRSFGSGYRTELVKLHPDFLPRLRSLELKGFPIPKHLHSYSHLRSLALETFTESIDLDMFLDVVDALPHLESLSFYINRCVDSDDERSEVISLPSLHTLDLYFESYAFGMQALASLRVPAARSVTVMVEVPENDVDTVYHLLPPDPNLILPMRAAVTSAELLIRAEGDNYTIRVHDVDQVHKIELSLSGPQRDFPDFGDGFDWRHALPRALRELFLIVPTSPLTSISLYGGLATVGVSEWRDVFVRYPRLESITLRGHGSAETFWTAIQSSSAESMPCPHLRFVQTLVSPSARSTKHGEFQAILNALRLRAQKGHRLEKLVVVWKQPHTADRDADYTRQVEELVGVVTWEVDVQVDLEDRWSDDPSEEW
ncbi:hypothetical protein C8Q76DRAFT_797667 [Earliella scabrosa]|nr:hypothetical protein C8Q76DRAFT_797667 [Earliella scabrosa]